MLVESCRLGSLKICWSKVQGPKSDCYERWPVGGCREITERDTKGQKGTTFLHLFFCVRQAPAVLHCKMTEITLKHTKTHKYTGFSQLFFCARCQTERRPCGNPTRSDRIRPWRKTARQISLVKTGWMVMISPSVRKNDLSNMVNPQVNSVQ